MPAAAGHVDRVRHSGRAVSKRHQLLGHVKGVDLVPSSRTRLVTRLGGQVLSEQAVSPPWRGLRTVPGPRVLVRRPTSAPTARAEGSTSLEPSLDPLNDDGRIDDRLVRFLDRHISQLVVGVAPALE
jgi:hypothetical protein